MKKILVVDDSALMRRVICDIINSDERFEVADKARDGLEAFDLLSRNTYDAVVLDVNMPKMNGLQLLKQLQKYHVSAKVMMASTDTMEGAQTTLDALEYGALDFVHKPENALDIRIEDFKEHFLSTLEVVANSKAPKFATEATIKQTVAVNDKVVEIVRQHNELKSSKRIIAIASSTGGPRALQSVIPKLPADINAPIVLVQHMPKGFTASLAERLNSLSNVTVTEAREGDILENGHVYLSVGGSHMNIVTDKSGKSVIHYSDEPAREGVKPCANYMFESLIDSPYQQVICVVLTGMGADGTQGIENLKAKKKIHVITQDQESCVVYGMPKSVYLKGLSDQQVALDQIAQEIIMNVGVK